MHHTHVRYTHTCTYTHTHSLTRAHTHTHTHTRTHVRAHTHTHTHTHTRVHRVLLPEEKLLKETNISWRHFLKKNFLWHTHTHTHTFCTGFYFLKKYFGDDFPLFFLSLIPSIPPPHTFRFVQGSISWRNTLGTTFLYSFFPWLPPFLRHTRLRLRRVLFPIETLWGRLSSFLSFLDSLHSSATRVYVCAGFYFLKKHFGDDFPLWPAYISQFISFGGGLLGEAPLLFLIECVYKRVYKGGLPAATYVGLIGIAGSASVNYT